MRVRVGDLGPAPGGARYADEGAAPQSQQAFYSIDVYGPGLPWSHEVVALIDELGAERLPDHLTREQREERTRRRDAEAERERQHAERERQHAEREQLVADALERVDGLDPDGRAKLLADVVEKSATSPTRPGRCASGSPSSPSQRPQTRARTAAGRR